MHYNLIISVNHLKFEDKVDLKQIPGKSFNIFYNLTIEMQCYIFLT